MLLCILAVKVGCIGIQQLPTCGVPDHLLGTVARDQLCFTAPEGENAILDPYCIDQHRQMVKNSQQELRHNPIRQQRRCHVFCVLRKLHEKTFIVRPTI